MPDENNTPSAKELWEAIKAGTTPVSAPVEVPAGPDAGTAPATVPQVVQSAVPAGTAQPVEFQVPVQPVSQPVVQPAPQPVVPEAPAVQAMPQAAVPASPQPVAASVPQPASGMVQPVDASVQQVASPIQAAPAQVVPEQVSPEQASPDAAAADAVQPAAADGASEDERVVGSLFRTLRGDRIRREPEDRRRGAGKKKAEKGTIKSIVIDAGRLLMKIVLIIAAFMAMFTFIFGIARIQDETMIPSVRDGDILLYYRLDKSFTNQELAVIKYEGSDTCGRVVARAGDVVNIDNQGLVINGNHQQENDIYFDTTQVVDGVTFPLTVPDNAVFLLGDNRAHAVDSRIYGCVDLDDVEGKVMFVMRRRNF